MKFYRFAFESLGRCIIVIWIMSMYWTVYSNHNPIVLEYIWINRIFSFALLIWVFIPLYDFVKEIVITRNYANKDKTQRGKNGK